MSGVGRHLAAVEIDGERDVALLREPVRLPLDEVVQAPPLLDDDDGGLLAGALRRGHGNPRPSPSRSEYETILPAPCALSQREQTAAKATPRKRDFASHPFPPLIRRSLCRRRTLILHGEPPSSRSTTQDDEARLQLLYDRLAARFGLDAARVRLSRASSRAERSSTARRTGSRSPRTCAAASGRTPSATRRRTPGRSD